MLPRERDAGPEAEALHARQPTSIWEAHKDQARWDGGDTKEAAWLVQPDPSAPCRCRGHTSPGDLVREKRGPVDRLSRQRGTGYAVAPASQAWDGCEGRHPVGTCVWSRGWKSGEETLDVHRGRGSSLLGHAQLTQQETG